MHTFPVDPLASMMTFSPREATRLWRCAFAQIKARFGSAPPLTALIPVTDDQTTLGNHPQTGADLFDLAAHRH